MSTHNNLVTVRIPRELSDRVAKIAAREFETRSNMIRRLIRAGLKSHDAIANNTPTHKAV